MNPTHDVKPSNDNFAFAAREAPNDPDAVVRDRTMTVAEKRSRLASWASDARAVPNYPALRRLDDGTVRDIDDILEALNRLDALPDSGGEPSPDVYRSGHWSRLSRLWRRRLGNDDDDDDPFTPAPAGPWPFPTTPQSGELAAA